MKQLIMVASVLAAAFASTFLILNKTGVLTVDNIELTLNVASSINPVYVALTVVLLLFLDMFIAIPTLTVSILAGYFLGFHAGGVSAFSGMFLAGLCGYLTCWKFGPRLLLRIYKNQSKLNEMRTIFADHGAMVLIMCRAAPILPEVACCLAGATRMPMLKFLLFYGIATAPYAFIAAYAGSRSTLSDPKPAILTAIAMSLFLWISWALFLKRNYGKKVGRVEPDQS